MCFVDYHDYLQLRATAINADSKLITKIQRRHRIRITEIIPIKLNDNHNAKKFKFRVRSFVAKWHKQL